MPDNLSLAALLGGSYFLGSLPFGLWIAYRLSGVDIRTVGSGNIGSTNVSRICGPTAGTFVFILDVSKGLVPPLVGALVMHVASPWQILAALLAVVGHNYSIWLGFRGGKGIATSLGALLGVAPLVGLSALFFFAIGIGAARYVSVGSMLAAASLPPMMLLLYPHDYYRLGFGIVACMMALYKHRANIQRLRAGTEPKLGRKRASQAAADSLGAHTAGGAQR